MSPDAGEIWFGNENVTGIPPEKRGIGLVFQNYALYPHMTVLQNIMFPLINTKTPKQKALVMAEEMAELVQIKELLAAQARGAVRRAAAARGYCPRAGQKAEAALLLDEPLSNLDARLRMETREEIRRIQREVGITSVFVTHDQEEAMSISDRIAVIREGALAAVRGTAADVQEPPESFRGEIHGYSAHQHFGGGGARRRAFLRRRKAGRRARPETR